MDKKHGTNISCRRSVTDATACSRCLSTILLFVSFELTPRLSRVVLAFVRPTVKIKQCYRNVNGRSVVVLPTSQAIASDILDSTVSIKNALLILAADAFIKRGVDKSHFSCPRNACGRRGSSASSVTLGSKIRFGARRR